MSTNQSINGMNSRIILQSGKTYIAGRDFPEGFIELKPMKKYESGLHYRVKNLETNTNIESFSGYFGEPGYLTIAKGHALEIHSEVVLNSYTEGSHIGFGNGVFNAGEDFKAGLVKLENPDGMVSYAIVDADTLEKISSAVSTDEVYITIHDGQALMVFDSLGLVEYTKK